MLFPYLKKKSSPDHVIQSSFGPMKFLLFIIKLLKTVAMDCSPSGFSAHGILQAGTQEWVAMPSSRGSSQPRIQTQVSCIAGGFFTTEPPRKPLQSLQIYLFWTFHILCGLLWLAAFTEHHGFEIHPQSLVSLLHHFLWLNNIPLHGYTIFHLSICQPMEFRLFPSFGYYE